MPTNEHNSFLSFQKNMNLLEFIKEILNRWYIFVISILVCVIISFVNSAFLTAPLYNSTAKLYVLSKQSQSYTTSDFSISTYITWDLSEIVTDELVLEEVSTNIKKKYTPSQLKGFISIKNPDNTRIIELTVKSPNAKDSKLIVDNICDISQEKLIEILGQESIHVLRYGEIAENPSSPIVSRDVTLGFFIGFALAIAAVFLIYITDNTITSAKDIEEYLGINILATIPYNQNKAKSKN